MKKYLAALSATAMISLAPYALAASSTDLTVTGTITPAACMPSLSDGGVVDIGKLPVKDLKPNTYTLVNNTSMALSVACDASVLFAVNAIDNKSGTSFNNSGYGLGLTDAGEKIGAFAAKINSLQADGIGAGAIDSVDNGTTWVRTSWLQPNRLTAAHAAGTYLPIPAQEVVMNLTVQTWIAATNGLTLTDEVTVDGSATFEMKYL